MLLGRAAVGGGLSLRGSQGLSACAALVPLALLPAPVAARAAISGLFLFDFQLMNELVSEWMKE